MNSVTETIEISDPERLVQKPLITVLMLTYNHADYIADAIEGVVSQQCDSPFELIIGEDASKDRTRSIALEYQKRYPAVIRVVYSAVNVGMHPNIQRIFARARGEFVAFCEGDDYWCSPHKLARQVQLMMSDERVGIVHADWVRSRFENGAWRFDFRKSVHQRVPMRLLQGDLFPTWHFPKILRTCTILLRLKTLQELGRSGLARREYKFGDSILSVYVTAKWRVAYLPEVVAVYRESANSALRSGAPARVALYKSCLEFDSDARAFFAGSYAYGNGYRWEAAVALLLWSIRAKDMKSALFALRDMRQHFGFVDFIVTGCKTLFMRWPTLRRQPRVLPERPAANELS